MDWKYHAVCMIESVNLRIRMLISYFDRKRTYFRAQEWFGWRINFVSINWVSQRLNVIFALIVCYNFINVITITINHIDTFFFITRSVLNAIFFILEWDYYDEVFSPSLLLIMSQMALSCTSFFKKNPLLKAALRSLIALVWKH